MYLSMWFQCAVHHGSSAAMTGQSVDIFWEVADRAESYKLERRVDSGGWTQVYAGDDLTYTDTVQSGWTSVQYRISAGISGVYGGLTVSNVVSIIPVSSSLSPALTVILAPPRHQ
mgnify:CR=1 FL=1